jgi:hypothetical protein
MIIFFKCEKFYLASLQKEILKIYVKRSKNNGLKDGGLSFNNHFSKYNFYNHSKIYGM